MTHKELDDKSKELKDNFLFYLTSVILLSICIIGSITLAVLWMFNNFIIGGLLYLIIVEPLLIFILKRSWSDMKSWAKK
jgi:hypothetical protein